MQKEFKIEKYFPKYSEIKENYYKKYANILTKLDYTKKGMHNHMHKNSHIYYSILLVFVFLSFLCIVTLVIHKFLFKKKKPRQDSILFHIKQNKLVNVNIDIEDTEDFNYSKCRGM